MDQGTSYGQDNNISPRLAQKENIMRTSETIVSSLPAGGWRIRYVLTNGTTWSEPLVGWAVYADGSVQALTTDRGGYVEGAECTDKCEIYHPDQEPIVTPSEGSAKLESSELLSV